jgi:hypothetical protein
MSGGALWMRLVPAIVSPAMLFLQFAARGITYQSILHAGIALVECYGIAFLILFAWNAIAAVPAMLRERDDKIADLVHSSVDAAHIAPALADVRACIESAQAIYAPNARREDHDLWQQKTSRMLDKWFGHPALRRFDNAGETGPTLRDQIDAGTLLGAREKTHRQVGALRKIADAVKSGEIMILDSNIILR